MTHDTHRNPGQQPSHEDQYSMELEHDIVETYVV